MNEINFYAKISLVNDKITAFVANKYVFQALIVLNVTDRKKEKF